MIYRCDNCGEIADFSGTADDLCSIGGTVCCGTTHFRECSYTRDRKTYKTSAQAHSAALYLNRYGKQRERYEWYVVQRVYDDGAFELVRAPVRRVRQPA